MSNVVEHAFPGGIVTIQQKREFEALDAAIVGAINTAKTMRVPQGLIVALLHGHAHAQTARMIEG